MRPLAMIDGATVKRSKTKVPTVKKYHLKASCSSFNTPVPEELKKRIA